MATALFAGTALANINLETAQIAARIVSMPSLYTTNGI
jgi:hypothetical protein